jgi:hypothetical protein
MFYCNDCAKKNGYPESICKSVGTCELCGKIALCSDRPSSSLPMSTLKGELGLDMNPPAEPKDLFSRFAGTALFPDFPKRKITTNELLKFLSDAETSGLKPANGSKFTLKEVEEYIRNAEMTKQILKIKKTPEHPYRVVTVPSYGYANWMGGAYCLAFVYSKSTGNFVLKGYYKEVQDYLKNNYTHYFVNYTLWAHGEHRDIWDFWKDSIGIFSPTNKRRNWKYQVRPYSNSIMDKDEMAKKTFKFKRLPKRWIPEFDQL